MNIESLHIETVKYRDEIAAIKNIRTQVFQREQGVLPKLEFDGLDEGVIHLLAYLDNKAVGTARIRAINANRAKIERLAVLSEARKQGIGKQLMKVALKAISDQNKSSVIVHAQEYIAPLYRQLGFEIIGERFSEAGIAHVKMIKQLQKT
jgi:predicted GNAT family N-acyltransferase